MRLLRYALVGFVFAAVSGTSVAGDDFDAVIEQFASCSTPDAAAPLPKLAYRGIGITTIPGGESVEADRGVVWFRIRLAPAALASGHTLTIAYDSRRLPITETGLEFSLAGIERGEHTIQASIVDTEGNEIIGTQPIKFFVRQTWWLTPGLSGLL
jgi:hypothetical protein